MPIVMAALPNIGGALWNPMKLAGVPQSRQSISAISGPKFTILWRHMEEISLSNKFFSDYWYMP